MPARPNAKPNAQVSAQVNAEALVQNQAPAPAPGSSSWIPAMPTQTRLYSEIIAHGSISGQCQGVGNQKGAVGNDLPAIRPVFKTPLPDGRDTGNDFFVPQISGGSMPFPGTLNVG